MLDYYLVAFIDILGYSSMVKSDLEGPKGEEKYFAKLLNLYKETASLKYENLNFDIIQFSDSVIISAPYEKIAFEPFLKLIAEYQWKLLKENILCRGGITFGKHFFKDGFLFSSALIDAYSIESKLARYPRIIISKDLIDLISVDGYKNPYIISDNNYSIINFFHVHKLSEDEESQIIKLITQLENSAIETLSEKGLWLKELYSHRYPNEYFKYERFK